MVASKPQEIAGGRVDYVVIYQIKKFLILNKFL